MLAVSSVAVHVSSIQCNREGVYMLAVSSVIGRGCTC